jgi:hypothetical protein
MGARILRRVRLGHARLSDACNWAPAHQKGIGADLSGIAVLPSRRPAFLLTSRLRADIQRYLGITLGVNICICHNRYGRYILQATRFPGCGDKTSHQSRRSSGEGKRMRWEEAWERSKPKIELLFATPQIECLPVAVLLAR